MSKRYYSPVPLSSAQAVEALAVASLVLRHFVEVGPAPAGLGDTRTYLGTLTRLRERVKEHGLPPSLAGRGVAGRGARRKAG